MYKTIFLIYQIKMIYHRLINFNKIMKGMISSQFSQAWLMSKRILLIPIFQFK